jgi:hypothetical protein
MLGRLSKTLLRALLAHLYLGPQILHSMSPYHHAGTPPIEFFLQKEWLGLVLEMV